VMVGKTCRLCVVCEVLITHEHEIAPLLVASGVATYGTVPNYLVLGTVDTRVWRSGMAGDVSLDTVKLLDIREVPLRKGGI
jgi:hypothetical protein